MNVAIQWLLDLDKAAPGIAVNGLVPVTGFRTTDLSPEQRIVMEKAEAYDAQYVFFEGSRNNRPPVAQAFVYVSRGSSPDKKFADLHKRLWSWGGVPLIYRKTAGLVQLFRCAHKPDFEQDNEIVVRPFSVLHIASQVSAQVDAQPWWNATRLHNGTLWDDPQVCKELLSNRESAQKTLITAVQNLHEDLKGVLPHALRRRLLILSILIAYLEARGVFEEDFFTQFQTNATTFFQVLSENRALLRLLDHLEQRFNGNVFTLAPQERAALSSTNQLRRFAQLVEGRQERGGQLTLWKKYSFADLPVELISHIYQLFVKDSSVEVYTPHFLVRLMLGEVLSLERLDRLEKNNEIILDGACGSGVFLVEAYKRLVLHWRVRNNWKKPTSSVLSKLLVARIRGIDKEAGAVELAAFSLCLALCDALEPKEIRTSIKLFPPLMEKTLHTSCFFEALESGVLKDKIGVVVGNPPFTSTLDTPGARRAYERYRKTPGAVPDKQLAYLFLNEPMQRIAPGGIMCMLQQYNFLYNEKSLGFRQAFLKRWDVREILDFISVRGLFHKGDADTKVIVLVAEASPPQEERQILHATFRRTGRTDAEQGFDIDYYDMHWIPRALALANDSVWRANLLGGGRLLSFVDRLRKFRNIGQYVAQQGWHAGEGFQEGRQGISQPARHIIGQPLLPSTALTHAGIDKTAITVVPNKPIVRPRLESLYTPPMLLIRELMDFPHALWAGSYLTFKDTIVGIAAPSQDKVALSGLDNWLSAEAVPLSAYIAAISNKLFTKKATAISAGDIFALPYPKELSLDLSENERVLTADVVNYYCDLIRLGEGSEALKRLGQPMLQTFNEVFLRQINGVYRRKPLKALPAQAWPGVLCQPYVFGGGTADWIGADALRDKLDALLREKRENGVDVTRTARIYDGRAIYLLKPDRLRYWLGSTALRDADETLSDLVAQGF